jgi:hypothetical protein
MAQSATLASAGTAVIVLNPVAKSTTVQLTATAASTGAVQVDYSLDDPTIPGGPTTTWSLLSSAAAMTSSTISSSPLSWTVLSPIGQVRINSSAVNTGNVFTLKALQSVTA